MKIIISIFILLFLPILYKMVKDWNGFDHGSNKEFNWTAFIIILNSAIMAFFKTEDIVPIALAKCLLVSIFGFQLFFPYLINWRLSYRFGFTPPRLMYVLNHLSDTAKPDSWKWYRALGWPGRLALWLTLFLLSVKWFTL